MPRDNRAESNQAKHYVQTWRKNNGQYCEPTTIKKGRESEEKQPGETGDGRHKNRRKKGNGSENVEQKSGGTRHSTTGTGEVESEWLGQKSRMKAKEELRQTKRWEQRHQKKREGGRGVAASDREAARTTERERQERNQSQRTNCIMLYIQ